MLELFYSPGSCSLVAHIALSEADADFALRPISIGDRAHLAPGYLAINPKGRVPALREGDWVLTENSAILPYLAGRYPEAGLVPTDLQAAARVDELLSFFASTVHIAFGQYWRPERFSDDLSLQPAIKAGGRAALEQMFDAVEALLVGRTWLLGETYSVADGYPLTFYRWGIRIGSDMRVYPGWGAHTERMLARPAVQRAMANEGIGMGPVGVAA